MIINQFTTMSESIDSFITSIEQFKKYEYECHTIAELILKSFFESIRNNYFDHASQKYIGIPYIEIICDNAKSLFGINSNREWFDVEGESAQWSLQCLCHIINITDVMQIILDKYQNNHDDFIVAYQAINTFMSNPFVKSILNMNDEEREFINDYTNQLYSNYVNDND